MQLKSSSTPFIPSDARYFDLIQQSLNFNDEELTTLAQHGFVLSERLRFANHFKRAYAWIYWQDLPVLVTTDSILHAIHRTYDEMVQQIETKVLLPQLTAMLRATRDYVRGLLADAALDERLRPYYEDLDSYLTVPLILVSNEGEEDETTLSPNVKHLLDVIKAANGTFNTWRKDEHGQPIQPPHVGVEQFHLFGVQREIDFTLFYPRGHYDDMFNNYALKLYFTAMMWLALVDFRFVEINAKDEAILQPGQLVAAHLLRDAITQTGQRAAWDNMEQILQALVGWSDNVTFAGLDTFIADTGITHPADYLTANGAKLLALLLKKDYGNQRIRGHVQNAVRTSKNQAVYPVSFAFFGQRFTLESYILGEVAFDRLVVDGKPVKRAYPLPLDVMAALGNDRALEHLTPEFEQYGYQRRIETLRDEVKRVSLEFWENSFYNHWLNMIRALNQPPAGTHVPPTMQAPVWADKMLHTQLASWAQLRHDNILYAKPPAAPMSVCDYPAGYVEPYPAFYEAAAVYARFGRGIGAFLPDEGDLRGTLMTYFDRLEGIALQLAELAKKELAGIAFSEEETLFLRSIVVRKYVGDAGYGGRTEEHWNGWYIELLPFDDKTPELVTEVYANPHEEIGIPGVLYHGTGEVVVLACLVQQPEETGTTLYVGPAFTYYEHFVPGYPPARMNDQVWSSRLRGEGLGWGGVARFHELDEALEEARLKNDEQRINKISRQIRQLEALAKDKTITSPAWTHSFRVISHPPTQLALPDAIDNLELGEALLGKIKAAGMLAFKWGSEPVVDLAKAIRDTPEKLLEAGITQAELDDLSAKLKAQGHWRDD